MNLNEKFRAIAEEQQKQSDKFFELSRISSGQVYFTNIGRAIAGSYYAAAMRSAAVMLEEELHRAQSLFPPFNSSHEGYAVLLEEFDELWEEIKNNKNPDTMHRQRKEAVQVAAMAMRFLVMLDEKIARKEDNCCVAN